MAESDPSFQVINESNKNSLSGDSDNRTNVSTNSEAMPSYDISTEEGGGKAALHMSIKQIQTENKRKEAENKVMRSEMKAMCTENKAMHTEIKTLRAMYHKLAEDYEQATGISVDAAGRGQPSRSRSPGFLPNTEMDENDPRNSPKHALLISHGHRVPSPSPSPSVESFKGGSAASANSADLNKMCSQILDKDLSLLTEEVQKKFRDFVSIVAGKICTNSHLRHIQGEQATRIDSLIATLKFVSKFLLTLELFTCSTVDGSDDSNDFPTRLTQLLVDSRGTGHNHHLKSVWKLILWRINFDIGNLTSPPLRTFEEVDAWYAADKLKEHQHVNEWDHLYVSLCNAFGLEERSTGLATSILGDEASHSPEASSTESSLSIPPEELWCIKSIIQGLVEKFEDLTCEVNHIRSKKGQTGSDLDDDNDMYLPQKDALETYDLGKLMLTMSSALESLHGEIKGGTTENQLCYSCRRNISGLEGSSHQANGFISKPTKSIASLPRSAVFIPGGMRSGTRALGSGLHSTEKAGDVFQPLPQPPPIRAGAITVVPPRPDPGTFQGIKGPQLPRRLMIISNDSPHTRSKSDSSLGHVDMKKQTTVQNLRKTRPNSLENGLDVFESRTRRSTQDRRLDQEGYTQNERGDDVLSVEGMDSDEDYEVCGPPDTPPQVRAMNEMLLNGNSNQSTSDPNWGAGARRRHNAGDHFRGKVSESGEDNSPPMFLANQSPAHGAAMPKPTHVSYNQVQQCTGDNIGTQRDILLPSSVEWSTLQMRDGGIPSPTLEDMNPYSSSMVMADRSIQDRQCPVCNIWFPDSESIAAIYEHVQSHFDKDSPETRVPSREHSKPGKDSKDNPMISQNVKAQEVLAKTDLTVDRQCPVCNVTFPSYVPMVGIYSHINLHFDPVEFEVVDDSFKKD